jgi:hypothetical protein
MLKRILEQDPNLSWNEVAEMMPGRTARQVRERYKNYLSPHLNNGTWSETEDELLRQKFAEFGPRWSILKKFFSNRSDVNIKNRWATLLSQDCRAEWRENNSPKEVKPVEPVQDVKQADSVVEKHENTSIFTNLEHMRLFENDPFAMDPFSEDGWTL